MLEMALIENIQRENLNAIEVALSFQRMLDGCNLKQEQLGERVGKNRTDRNQLPAPVEITSCHSDFYKGPKDIDGACPCTDQCDQADKQLFIHDEIIEKGLSVRKVEELVRSINSIQLKPKQSRQSPGVTFEYQKLQRDLASKFATKVKLKVGENGKGAIEIPFVSEDDLSRILELLDW